MKGKSFEIVSRAIIKDSNRAILLVKRAKEPEKDKWALPGGKVEFGEKSDEAIKREIMEELNLDFVPELAFFNDNFTSVPGIHCLVLYFLGGYSGDIRLKLDENTEYKFFSKEDIRKSSDIGFDHREVLLKNLD
ncbi:NUDIX hydrolase [Candidatus Poribacteria bacterium]